MTKSSGVAKSGPGWARVHPNSLGQQGPLDIAITNKSQVVHTLAARYFCSAADIEISSRVSSYDQSSFGAF